MLGYATLGVGDGHGLPRVLGDGRPVARVDQLAARQPGAAHRGGRVLGICGGYQMLGYSIDDPDGYDGEPACVRGLGLLNVDTVMTREKTVTPAQGKCAQSGLDIDGYEIHAGETTGSDTDRPFAILRGQPEGARSADGRIQGTYIHGAFAADAFRGHWLKSIGVMGESGVNYQADVEAALDALADGVEEAVDVEALFDLAVEPAMIIRTP